MRSAKRFRYLLIAVLFSPALLFRLPVSLAVEESGQVEQPAAGTGMYSTYVDTRAPFFGEELGDAYPIEMDDLVPALLKAIDHLSKYQMPHQLPAVYRVSQEEVAQLACGKACAALAAYRSGEGIYIDQALKPETNIFARSVLLHELVHYVQDVSNELASLRLCERWYRREQEAYAIQKRFLVLVGSQIRVAYSAGSTCDQESAHVGKDLRP